ncbi:carboxyvinyl-carboxyphosphonate phosphorylmutase [Microgenomates group bacterium RBG_16_45_19]|nr:MAG: carboxyvinyl-carboxyphosphonate phosphorylmutase [Microgenomates group bacterium RBG_16_45_19]
MKKTARLRRLLESSEILVAPGATDAFMARIIEEAGFPIVYVTGGGVSNTLGYPDVGLVTMSEMVTRAKCVADSVNVPTISDANTGYGNPINVIRTVREFERAGVAGIHIEDQVTPKRCGHFSGKEVISAEEMVRKIEAAIEAKEDEDFVVIARTDSRQVYGIEEAIKRGRKYAKAGADLIFVEAPQSIRELEIIADSIDAPLVANIVEGGKTPLVNVNRLREMGYRLVIFANTALRIAGKAVKEAMAMLHSEGTTESLLNRMLSWEERQRIVRLETVQNLEKKYIK